MTASVGTGRAEREARRVVIVPGGPVLVEGPVRIEEPDGSTRICDRFVVALCACRRSRRYPLCDTSHRRHSRPRGGDPTREDGATSAAQPSGGSGP